MLTDEDIDCQVQDISDAGGAPLGSIEKPFAIDAIQKHVEESLLFLDEEKSENKTGSTYQQTNVVLEKSGSGSDDTIMQDVDDNSKAGEPQKSSAVILKQENLHVKQETINIPKQVETNDVILSLEDNLVSDSVLKETNIDAMNSENKPSKLELEQSDSKACNVLQDDNRSSLSMLNETDIDATIYDSEFKSSDISEQSDASKVYNASQDNSSFSNMLNETNTDAEKNNYVKEKTSDISMVLHERVSRSDSLLDETDVDRTMNYESQEEFGDSSKQMTNNEISSVSSEQKSPSDSLLAQECIIGSPQQTDEMVGSKSSIVPQEENRTSEVLLEEADTVAAISGFQEETINISEEIDSNEISNISKVDNNLLNESNTDAAMKESLEIPEQIETQKVDTIYKVHNAINTDVTINDSQEEIIDLTELIDSTDVSMVSQENLSSDSVLNITDEALNDTQEKNDDSETYNIDDSTISEKYSGPSVMELDKTNIVLHEGYETDSKTIETVGNCQDNLKSIKKADHENSVPQEGGILIESKEHNNQTDEPTQGIENTTREDKDHDKLPKLESNVEKSSLPEDKTHVMNEVIKTEQATEKSQEKELVWEVKPIKHELEQNVTENPTKKNPLVRAAPTEDVTECPPTKRPRSQPVWTTNPIYDEDKPKAEQGTCSSKSDNTATDKPANDTKADDPLKPYIISQEEKKQLKTWLVKSGLVPKEKFKCVLNIINGAKMNKAVLKMAPIPKDYKPMDVLRVIRDQTKVYEKDITKDIQFIHIGKHDDKFNAAYIKWRDIQKLLVVKAHSILATKSFIVDGLVQQPLFEYDDRSIIDWNENDRPIIKQKDGDIEIPTTVSTPALTPVVTTIATVAATNSSVAATVATVVAKPRYKKPPPAPFTTGQMNVKDKKTFGLSPAFINYYNLKPPIVSFVFISNLDTSHSVESYHKIFGAAGEILEIEVLPPPNDEQPSLKLRISYNHPLEAVQAISMFHEQILFNRLIQVEIGDLSMKKKLFNIEGFDNIGPGLGTNGFIMLNIRSNIELSKFKARTKIEMDNLRVKISSLRHKLASTVYKMDQAKRDEEKRRYKEEKRHTQNKTQNKQSNMDAVNAITTAIASSVQANVISMLGMKQDQNVKQNTPPTPAKPHAPASNQPVGISQRQNTSRAPVNWTAKENPIALPTTTLPTTILPTTALPTTARQNRNMPSQTSMGHPFQNLGSELHGYQNPLDPYSYYASMQQAYAQYGYAMDPTLMQAYVQPGLPYMQPGIVNVQPVPPIANLQPVPAINTSNMPLTAPKTQSMPTIISNQPGPSKPSNPTQTKVHTQSKTIFPPLTTNKTGTVYEVQKPLPRFDLPPANAGNTTATNLFDVAPGTGWQTTVAENKVQEIPLPIPTISQTSVKTAFKTQKPIVPPKVTKPLSINMKIPSVLPEAVPLVLQNPRTQEKNSVQQKFTTMAGKVSSVPWINKQIKEMRRNSKSPERIRKSPEKIKSPDWSQNALLPPKAVRRMSRSPERRNSRSPIRRRSRSAERRRVSRSPKRRMSRSPIRRRSRSPIRRRSRSPVRRRSIERRRMSRSPKRRMSRSPKRRSSRSPIRRKSKSPIRRRSRSPKRRISRSPRKRISKSPVRSMPPSEIGKADRLQSSELGPKSTPRPAYEPDGASRVKTNVDLDFNYMAREIANTAVNFSYLPPSVATEDLTDKMCEIGELLEVRALGMGKAKVVFKFRHDAETCIEMYNKAKVDGQMIQVRWASIDYKSETVPTSHLFLLSCQVLRCLPNWNALEEIHGSPNDLLDLYNEYQPNEPTCFNSWIVWCAA